MPLPYSSARLGKVSACERTASCWNTGHVSAGGPGISASTTRAPSDSSRSGPGLGCVARLRLAAVGEIGRARSSPTVRPRSRGSGTGRPVSTDHTAATSSTERAIGPTVSNDGQSGTHPVDRDRAVPRLQADDLAGGGGQPHRAARVRADPEVAEPGRDRGRVAARRAARRQPGSHRVVHGPVPLVRPEHAPGELREVRLPDDDGAGVEQRARRRSRCRSGTWSA